MSLDRLTKKKRERTHDSSIRNEREETTVDPMDIKTIIKEHYELI